MNNKLYNNKEIELLLPAGNLDVLKIAFHYGADAVYIGGNAFNLRKKAKNFTIEDMREALEYAHNINKKVYLTLNIIPHNKDIPLIKEFLNQVKEEKLDFDAVIVGDLATISLVKSILPEIEIHISTQTSPTNYETINIYETLGAKRVILARELSFEEISEISENVKIDTEMFIHGAMCISYSGRCLLSAYMTNRNANDGHCSHPCRWKYFLREEKRENEHFEVEEDEYGTYIMNSKDLCLAENIDKVIKSGVCSLKIEGRNKGSHYVAIVAKTYRALVDEFLDDPDNFKFHERYLKDLSTVSHRKYTSGFFIDKPDHDSHNYENSAYIRHYKLVGIVNEIHENGDIIIDVKNKICEQDLLEFVTRDEFLVHETKNMKKKVYSKELDQFFIKEVDEINNQNILIINDPELAKKVSKLDIIRKKL